MWAVEGLTHRYPTKVLAELLSTCPQYCGHCTRMDLVGNDTPQVDKLKFTVREGPARADPRLPPRAPRRSAMWSCRAATSPTCTSPSSSRSSRSLLDIPNIRDIRLASKGLSVCRSTSCRTTCSRGWSGWRRRPSSAGVDLALHCHANHAEQITPLVGRAVHGCSSSASATSAIRASCCAA